MRHAVLAISFYIVILLTLASCGGYRNDGSLREGWSDTARADGETAVVTLVSVCWMGGCPVTSQASPF